MQSLKFSNFSSLGARRTKHGFGQRATWLMVTLAALFAVLAVAVPTPRSASAADPTVSITVSSPNHETATATITATGVTSNDWKLRVNYKTVDLEEKPPSHRQNHYMESISEFSQIADDQLGNMRFKSDYDDNDDTLSATFKLTRLVPDTNHWVEVVLTSSGIYRSSPRTWFTIA